MKARSQARDMMTGTRFRASGSSGPRRGWAAAVPGAGPLGQQFLDGVAVSGDADRDGRAGGARPSQPAARLRLAANRDGGRIFRDSVAQAWLTDAIDFFVHACHLWAEMPGRLITVTAMLCFFARLPGSGGVGCIVLKQAANADNDLNHGDKDL